MSVLINENRRELLPIFDQTAYMKIWFDLVEKMEKEGFTWASLLENEEWNQYMSPSLYSMSQEQWNRIIEATNGITNILQKTWKIINGDRDLFIRLGIPVTAWDAVLMESPNSWFSYFCRYDFIINGDQIKLIEANVDTPTGLMEPSVANRLICEAHNRYHPNNIEDSLKKAWELIKKDYQLKPSDKIFFTSYDWHEEDRQTVHFNLMHCVDQEKEYVGIEDILVAEDGLYSPKGEKINFLYRLYPLEYLDGDVDSNGDRIGHQFLQHIANGQVTIINPPSAFLMQSKSVLALIWDLYESNSNYYTDDEKEVIRKYFLPTYFTPAPFIEQDIAYVSKPIWGREGGGVSIVEGETVEEDQTEYYYKQKKVYQQYIEMPDQAIGTWDDEYKGKLLFGSHVIGGEPAGLFLRVGERITGNLSMFMGITVAK